MTGVVSAHVQEKTISRAVCVTFFLLAFLPVAASFFLTTDGRVTTAHIGSLRIPLHTVCLLQYFTGYRCPVDGMTRTFAFMGHGQFTQALRMSVPGVLLYLFCLFEIPVRGIWAVRGEVPHILRILEPLLFAAVGTVDIAFFLAQFI